MSVIRKVVEDLTELVWQEDRTASFARSVRTSKFVGYVNVVKQAGQKIYRQRQARECLRHSGYTWNEYLEKYHEILMESVAETSEEFMERYFAR